MTTIIPWGIAYYEEVAATRIDVGGRCFRGVQKQSNELQQRFRLVARQRSTALPWRLLPRRLLGRQCTVVVVAVAVAVVVVVAAAAATCCWVCGCFWSLPNIPRQKCAAGFELQGLSSSEPVISPRQSFSCVIGVPVYGRLQAACVPPHGAAARRLLASCRLAATAIAR